MAAYVESIRRAPRTLTDREQKALLRVTGEHRAGWRDHVLFAMALGTGLRAHELVALDVGDVFDDAATGQGLLNYFLRAINCGAITEAEAVGMSSLTLEDLRTRSFVKILARRRA